MDWEQLFYMALFFSGAAWWSYQSYKTGYRNGYLAAKREEN